VVIIIFIGIGGCASKIYISLHARLRVSPGQISIRKIRLTAGREEKIKNR
jgi:hypothetical protein